MGLLEEFNRYLTGRNSAKFLEFKCPRCADIGSYDQSFFSEPGCYATCGRCNFEFGLHPESIYFRCICGIGLRGIGIDSINPLDEFVWKCSSCARRMFVSEPSASKCVYLCEQIPSQNFAKNPLDDLKEVLET